MVRIPTILLVPIGVGLAIIPLVVYWLYIGAYVFFENEIKYSPCPFKLLIFPI